MYVIGSGLKIKLRLYCVVHFCFHLLHFTHQSGRWRKFTFFYIDMKLKHELGYTFATY